MRNSILTAAVLVTGLSGVTIAGDGDKDTKTQIVSESEAAVDNADWGKFLSYFTDPTFGTSSNLAGVAIIKPGMEIHPPHVHADEEYLMVLEGNGVWHVNGKDFPAKTGDMLYSKPWEIHGIKNTGDTPLKFVVWKWGTKGKPAPKP